jgi:hypothetical protein
LRRLVTRDVAVPCQGESRLAAVVRDCVHLAEPRLGLVPLGEGTDAICRFRTLPGLVSDRDLTRKRAPFGAKTRSIVDHRDGWKREVTACAF